MSKKEFTYKNIFNPEKNITVNINSALGKKTLEKYLRYLNNSSFQRGGSGISSDLMKRLRDLSALAQTMGIEMPDAGRIEEVTKKILGERGKTEYDVVWALMQHVIHGLIAAHSVFLLSGAVGGVSVDDIHKYLMDTANEKFIQLKSEQKVINELFTFIKQGEHPILAHHSGFMDELRRLTAAIRATNFHPDLGTDDTILNTVAQRLTLRENASEILQEYGTLLLPSTGDGTGARATKDQIMVSVSDASVQAAKIAKKIADVFQAAIDDG